MFNSIFKIVYFIEFLTISVVRKYFTGRPLKQKVVRDRKTVTEIFWLAMNGIGMVIPLIYIFTSRLDFADYYLPDWIGWLGAIVFVLAIWLLYLSHRDLGRHWMAFAGIRENHQLITTGIYKHIRHPMYAAHLLWAIAQVMMLHNWIAGYSFLVTMLPFYYYRKQKEDHMLMEEFGEEFRLYKMNTGALLPKFRG